MLLSAANGVFSGDLIFQVVLLLILITVVAGAISLFVIFNKRKNQLNRIEEKLEKLSSGQSKKDQ